VKKVKTTVIAVVGGKSSGKTITIEVLTKELTRRGYKIAVVKHIPEPNFTIDREGKDTWRFAQSGAKTIVSVSSHEIATIEKIDTTSFCLEEILRRCGNVDLVLLEGFKKLVGKNYDILKIVTVKSAEEALEASKVFKPILAFTGLYSIETLNLNIPCINVLKNREKIVGLVETKCQKMMES
jgi:molybdopterin-guanine dinucleotide biosynthesis protein MobB